MCDKGMPGVFCILPPCHPTLTPALIYVDWCLQMVFNLAMGAHICATCTSCAACLFETGYLNLFPAKIFQLSTCYMFANLSAEHMKGGIQRQAHMTHIGHNQAGTLSTGNSTGCSCLKLYHQLDLTTCLLQPQFPQLCLHMHVGANGRVQTFWGGGGCFAASGCTVSGVTQWRQWKLVFSTMNSTKAGALAAPTQDGIRAVHQGDLSLVNNTCKARGCSCHICRPPGLGANKELLD